MEDLKMKPKKLDKKLTLNKKTISNLHNGEMKDARGGASAWQCTALPNDCYSWPILQCNSIKNC